MMSSIPNNNSSTADSQMTGIANPVETLSAVDFSDYSQGLLQTYQEGDQEVAASSQALNSRQGFTVGGLGLMIGYADASELIDAPAIYHVPNVPSWFVGIINLHGVVIPVFDLSDYVGVAKADSKHKKLLILGQRNEAVAIIIDGLPQRLRWSAEQRVEKSSAPSLLSAHITAACLIDDDLWFDLDSESLCQAFESMLE